MQGSIHLGEAQNAHGNPSVGLDFIGFLCVLEHETSQIRPCMFYAATLSRLSSSLADRTHQSLFLFFK